MGTGVTTVSEVTGLKVTGVRLLLPFRALSIFTSEQKQKERIYKDLLNVFQCLHRAVYKFKCSAVHGNHELSD